MIFCNTLRGDDDEMGTCHKLEKWIFSIMSEDYFFCLYSIMKKFGDGA